MVPFTLRIAALLSLLYLSTACAFGTTPIKVLPQIFDSAESSVERIREGDILVRRFVDNRPDDQREFIGSKRNGYGMVLGHLSVVKGTTLPDLMTEYFSGALEAAGYRTAVEGASDSEIPADFHSIATLEGGIEKFWLDMYMATWHLVEVSVSLLNNADEVLWEGLFEGEETNVLWLGISSEFAKVIRQALDKALGQAIADFSSDEFSKQVQISAGRFEARPDDISSPPDSESPLGGL